VSAPGVLIVIPARGGSKGIPRKNLRGLAGRPLIAYAIETALASAHGPEVIVSSDDDEILSVARSLGARALRRPSELASDDVTLDAVVDHALAQVREANGRSPDIVATVQPTSPLLSTSTLDRAIGRLVDQPDLDTLISGTDDRHLRWERAGGEFRPAYTERRNRQYLPQTYRETGGFLITRARHVTATSRIGPNVAIEPVDGPEAIDIDGVQDLLLCEAYLNRRQVVVVVGGNAQIGLGHVHNALILAGDLVRHDLRFLVPDGHDLAADALAAHHYPVHRQDGEALVDRILALGADAVINDILDTDAEYVISLKKHGLTVVNFEDLGPGARHADLVVNAIYPERQLLPGHHFGPRYFLARSEFLVGTAREIRSSVERVLVTFGGTDPDNLTARVLDVVGPICEDRQIAVDVILGRGYGHAKPASGDAITVHDNVGNISDFMRSADVAFTSAGRTVFELALVGTPSIILAQNEREMTHLFATEANGFVTLGLGRACPPGDLERAFVDLVEHPASRQRMRDLMQTTDLRGGRERVVRLVEDAIMRR
jgi:CMP-N-acetylneuraminic acid synthetase/spore coat polysaccharide biosynthesis predicted glycosyltransferase SpsG